MIAAISYTDLDFRVVFVSILSGEGNLAICGNFNRHNLKISSEFSFLILTCYFYPFLCRGMDVICDILLPDIIERKRRRGGGEMPFVALIMTCRGYGGDIFISVNGEK